MIAASDKVEQHVKLTWHTKSPQKINFDMFLGHARIDLLYACKF